MEKEIVYNSVPNSFSRCIQVNCMRADSCLRHRVFLYYVADCNTIPVINPARIPHEGTECRYYFADIKVRFARGITHLLDPVPHGKAIEIRRELYSYFKRNTYYRIRNKERLLSPADQSYVRKLFLRKGINVEPVFDEYIEQYDW